MLSRISMSHCGSSSCREPSRIRWPRAVEAAYDERRRRSVDAAAVAAAAAAPAAAAAVAVVVVAVAVVVVAAAAAVVAVAVVAAGESIRPGERVRANSAAADAALSRPQ